MENINTESLPKINILFLDNNSLFVRALKSILYSFQEKECDFRDINFLFATSNEEALTLFEQNKTIHALIQNYHRAETTGVQFAQQLYRQKTVPIIVYFIDDEKPPAMNDMIFESRASYVYFKIIELRDLLSMLHEIERICPNIVNCFPEKEFYDAVDSLPKIELFKLNTWLTEKLKHE